MSNELNEFACELALNWLFCTGHPSVLFHLPRDQLMLYNYNPKQIFEMKRVSFLDATLNVSC